MLARLLGLRLTLEEALAAVGEAGFWCWRESCWGPGETGECGASTSELGDVPEVAGERGRDMAMDRLRDCSSGHLGTGAVAQARTGSRAGLKRGLVCRELGSSVRGGLDEAGKGRETWAVSAQSSKRI